MKRCKFLDVLLGGGYMFFSLFTEQYEVVGAADPVFAVVGEDVVLPCLVKPNISVVDMRVEWFRFDLKDSVVHLYEDHVDKNKGNTSLKLSSVKVSDEGIYKFVGRLPVITVDGFDDSGGLHLQCESEGWNPEPVLEWLNSEGVSLSSETTDTHRNTDGFSVKHTITLHHSDKIHCRVRLRHHMLEAVIISSSNMFHLWRASAILFSVVVVLSGFTAVLIAVFIHEYRGKILVFELESHVLFISQSTNSVQQWCLLFHYLLRSLFQSCETIV
uniref:Zgc:123297 n=1 Tax=Sinocyclocheilus grahami TaxID=75366 RepID=A0A672LPG3_SINGR